MPCPVMLTIGLPSRATVLSYEENALTYWVEDQTGYELTFIPFSGGSDIATQISTTLAAQQALPDILYGLSLGADVYRGYGNDGYFRDLTPYFEDRNGASKVFWDRLEENFTQEEIDDFLRRMTDPDSGKIYAVPTIETSMIDVLDFQMWINTEWLDYLKLDKPTDVDSLYKVLKAFKTGDPNQNGKADEIPLYGGQEASMGADIINWIINMYLYFNDRKTWNVDDEGQLYAPFITNEYREALKFINKLIDEGLMLDSVFNTTWSEMKMITTPNNGVPIVGIFGGHLTLHVDYNNPLMEKYEPLQPWGNVIFNDYNLGMGNFITADCQNPDAAFKLMMTLWTEDGSRRVRYGEYGVNWTEADEGAMSDMGLPAEYKLIRDPLVEQNTCLWSGASCSLNIYAECETAQFDWDLNPGEAKRCEMHAQSRKLIDEAAAKNNPDPKNICPTLQLTTEEREENKAYIDACADYFSKSRTDFCTGQLNPNSDADWNKYVDTLWKLGLQEWIDVYQVAYDRG